MGMTYPIHPDDEQQLLRIRRYLIGFRYTEKMTQIELSRKVNGTEGVVHDLEANPSWQWRLVRLQDWCAAFGLRLEATLRISPTVDRRIHDHPVVGQLHKLSRGGQLWKSSQRAYLTLGLREARQAKHISAGMMGRKLSCTASAIRNWERDADQIMLPKALHYARMLGGFVELGWMEMRDGQS